MHITSPEDRAIAWRHALARRGEEREVSLRYLARDILEELRAPLSLYHEGEEELVETVLLLDRHDAFLDTDMLTAYQAVGVVEADADGAPGRLLVLMGARLGEVADRDGVEADERARALELHEFWREHVLSVASEQPDYLSVAEVAARFGVTPAAVYKWIHADKIKAEERPGGSYRIPAAQFRSTDESRSRRADFRRRAAARWRDVQPLSDEEVVEAVRSSRRGE